MDTITTDADNIADDTIAGVETTVDRSSKNNRIRNWINQVWRDSVLFKSIYFLKGAERNDDSVKEEENEEELSDALKVEEYEVEEILIIGTPE